MFLTTFLSNILSAFVSSVAIVQVSDAQVSMACIKVLHSFIEILLTRSYRCIDFCFINLFHLLMRWQQQKWELEASSAEGNKH
jgi:hypothetical protein